MMDSGRPGSIGRQHHRKRTTAIDQVPSSAQAAPTIVAASREHDDLAVRRRRVHNRGKSHPSVFHHLQQADPEFVDGEPIGFDHLPHR
jgi:hypothetical protein